MVELPDRRFYLATLFVPQLGSQPDSPHPLILAYLRAATQHSTQRSTRRTTDWPPLQADDDVVPVRAHSVN